MLKKISNLGKALSRDEQKTINGGRTHCVVGDPGYKCDEGEQCYSRNGYDGYCIPALLQE
jgi:hypothetical protein